MPITRSRRHIRAKITGHHEITISLVEEEHVGLLLHLILSPTSTFGTGIADGTVQMVDGEAVRALEVTGFYDGI